MASQRFLTPERVRRYPAVTAIVLVLVGVAIVAREGPHSVLGGDFRAFYTAGAFVLRGTPELLYDQTAHERFQHEVLGMSKETLSVWMNPPWAAWLFAPVAWLPFWVAFGALTLGSLLLFVRAVSLLRGELGIETPPRRLLVMLLQFSPAIACLCIGQMTAVWLLASAGIAIALRRGRDGVAGVALACFVMKPQLALGFAAMLLGARRFRPLLIAGLLASAIVILTEFVTPGALARYLRASTQFSQVLRSPDYPRAGLHGGAQVAWLLFDGFAPRAGTLVGWAISLALTAAIVALWWRRPWARGTAAFDLRLAASLALGLIASPHLYLYDLTLLAVPLLLAHAAFRRATNCAEKVSDLPLDGGAVFRAAALVWALGLAGPALTVLEQQLSEKAFGFQIALQLGVLGVAMLALQLVRASRRCGDVAVV